MLNCEYEATQVFYLDGVNSYISKSSCNLNAQRLLLVAEICQKDVTTCKRKWNAVVAHQIRALMSKSTVSR